MTTRERILAVLDFQKPDRLPYMDFGYWDETITTWHIQGLPHTVTTNSEVECYLGLEGVSIFPYVPLVNGMFPFFERTVIRHEGDHVIAQDHEGNLCEMTTKETSMPKYIKYVLETRSDWEKLKEERLNIHTMDRYGDLDLFAKQARKTGLPIIFNGGSLYGWLRNWMGVENFSYALLSEKEWVAEMMDHLVDLTLHLVDRLPRGLVDMAWWWEDMCYNHGPLMSPRLFNELMVPRYKQVTAALENKGVTHNILDCDGCIYELVPGWMEAGITIMFPLEAAHTNPLKLRSQYGQEIKLVGGVDKRALIAGREAIDRELEKLAPLVQTGGFLPTVDHRVPPDVRFENYLYYLEKRKEYF